MTMTQTMAPAGSLADILRTRRQKRREPELPDRSRRRGIRKAVGASLQDVATYCGVSTFAVNSWERPDGSTEPRGTNRAAYKQALDDLEALASEFNTQK